MTNYPIELPCIGEYVETPRFCKVKIAAILYEEDARKLGFVEPTHSKYENYKILGRHIGINLMDFAVVLKKETEV